MKTARMYHTLCVLDGCIYVIGGVGRNNRVLRSVECYDPVTNRWQFVKSMTTARAGASAAELDGKIFVSGGFGNTLSGMPPILDSVEVFHSLKNRWTARGRLRFGRCHANMTCVGGTLYLSGGLAVDSNTSRVLDVEDVDIYDAQNDSWWLRTCLDRARHSAAYFVSGQKLFLIGGIALNSKGTLKNSIECLDTRSNSWLATFELPSEVQWIRSVI
ncbi:alpha-scruin-like isoform X2 [Ostrea edulis]|uniref:alpha-scruin-like isoform X2 n=1 Tax=Ostrea edulis TaxID=37623 RepID=UPI002094EAAE|nr:alpha-scruin-like isoform X2 [Ostrea edulis]